VNGQRRKRRPVLDFLIATAVTIAFFAVLSIPALTLIVSGVLIAFLLLGVAS